MNNVSEIFLFFSGLAAAWQIIAIIAIFLIVLVGAALQKFIAKMIASKFMNIQISGAILWSCILGVILGAFAAEIILAFGGGIISLAIYLLATYPFFLMWVKKYAEDEDAEICALSHKEAIILSASSSFLTLVLLAILVYIISYAISFGMIAFFHWHLQSSN